MIFGTDRQQLRKQYHDAWQKHLAQKPLSALEQQIAEVISEHPEYHAAINDTTTQDKEWFAEQGETNPFLHMGLHLALREQLSIDQPAGIRDSARAVLKRQPDAHSAEHQMMNCLIETIWQAQQNQTEPDMQAYLSCLRHC